MLLPSKKYELLGPIKWILIYQFIYFHLHTAFLIVFGVIDIFKKWSLLNEIDLYRLPKYVNQNELLFYIYSSYLAFACALNRKSKINLSSKCLITV